MVCERSKCIGGEHAVDDALIDSCLRPLQREAADEETGVEACMTRLAQCLGLTLEGRLDKAEIAANFGLQKRCQG